MPCGRCRYFCRRVMAHTTTESHQYTLRLTYQSMPCTLLVLCTRFQLPPRSTHLYSGLKVAELHPKPQRFHLAMTSLAPINFGKLDTKVEPDLASGRHPDANRHLFVSISVCSQMQIHNLDVRDCGDSRNNPRQVGPANCETRLKAPKVSCCFLGILNGVPRMASCALTRPTDQAIDRQMAWRIK